MVTARHLLLGKWDGTAGWTFSHTWKKYFVFSSKYNRLGLMFILGDQEVMTPLQKGETLQHGVWAQSAWTSWQICGLVPEPKWKMYQIFPFYRVTDQQTEVWLTGNSLFGPSLSLLLPWVPTCSLSIQPKERSLPGLNLSEALSMRNSSDTETSNNCLLSLLTTSCQTIPFCFFYFIKLK